MIHQIQQFHRRAFCSCFLFSGVMLLQSMTFVQAEDWPMFRGGDRTNRSNETDLLQNWPSGGPDRVWLYENAGEGYSSFSIVDGKLYTMGTRGDFETLMALDANTGSEIWVTPVADIFRESRGNGPRSTPSVDGEHVYGLSSEGELVCAKISNGSIVWRKSFSDLGGSHGGRWAYSESVLVDQDKVIAMPGGRQGTVAAFNKLTGDQLWRTGDITDDAHYTSMIAVDMNGDHQYIALTDETLFGINAADGNILWEYPWTGRTAVIPTPVYDDNSVYVTSGYGVGCMLIKIDSDYNVTEAYKSPRTMVNHHGGVVKVGDYIYGFSDTDRGRWICQNFETGEVVWASDALGKGAVIYADGMLYCVDESSGEVALVEATPEGWNQQGRFRLDPQSDIRLSSGRVWTHPVVSNGKLFLRDQNLIYAYDVSAN